MKIKKLLDAGADVNFQDTNDNTLLHIAVQDNEPQVVEFLLDHGADISIKNKEDKRAIDLLSHKKRKSNPGQSTANLWDSALIARLEPVACCGCA
ncbi:MAG: ankyrin repeat domain-containing protein [Candidatus Symbiodolus clandestinus]